MSLDLNNIGASCQIPGSFVVLVSLGTPPYTFRVTDPNGNPVSTTPPTSEAGGLFFAVFFTATKLGPYTATVTDANGCQATCSRQFDPHLDVSVQLVSSSLCIAATFRASVGGGTAPYSFNVTDSRGNPVAVSQPSPGEFGLFVTFTATNAGPYTVTFTDAKGCQGKGIGEGVPCCSLTQSEWGQSKPKFNREKITKTVQRLFGSNFFNGRFLGNLLTVGVHGPGLRSVTFHADATSCITERMPASGPPAALPVGLGDALINADINPDTCQTSPPLPLVGDKFQNELLGQTIALTLNSGGVNDDGGLTFDTQSSPSLWHLVLCNTMVTQSVLPGDDGILGTQDDLLDPGPDGVLGSQDDPKLAVTIPISVLNAIAAASPLELSGRFTVRTSNGDIRVPAGSVGRLLILANLALAGETDLGGASLADINVAVDGINRAFDKCRFLIRCKPPR
jgi:hypothetical protein